MAEQQPQSASGDGKTSGKWHRYQKTYNGIVNEEMKPSTELIKKGTGFCQKFESSCAFFGAGGSFGCAERL